MAFLNKIRYKEILKVCYRLQEAVMTRKAIITRLIAVVSFFMLICFVLTVASKIVCAKFIGDSTSIVNGFYAEPTGKYIEACL